jgi:hypothetical protein
MEKPPLPLQAGDSMTGGFYLCWHPAAKACYESPISRDELRLNGD